MLRLTLVAKCSIYIYVCLYVVVISLLSFGLILLIGFKSEKLFIAHLIKRIRLLIRSRRVLLFMLFIERKIGIASFER